MSVAITCCPKCGTQSVSSAKFCGVCGASVANPSNVSEAAIVISKPSDDWHLAAGLICGVLSIFACGLLASIPGIYFSWSAIASRRKSGGGVGLGYLAMGLNGLGVLISILCTLLMIAAFVASASAAAGPAVDPYGY